MGSAHLHNISIHTKKVLTSYIEQFFENTRVQKKLREESRKKRMIIITRQIKLRPTSRYCQMEFNKLNNFCSTCLNLLFTSGNLLISTYIDTKANIKASHKVQTKQVPEKNYGNRLVSKPYRPSRRAIRAADLFLDIIRQNLIN